MRTSKQKTSWIVETPLIGFGVVLLALVCFLLLLWTLIVIVRVVLG